MLQLPMFVIHSHNDIHHHNADDVEQLQPAIIHYGICVCRLLWYLSSLAQEMYIASLIPCRSLPDFISQPWRKIRRRSGIKTTSRTGNGGLG